MTPLALNLRFKTIKSLRHFIFYATILHSNMLSF
jgi:hypothetical protein